MEKVGKQELCPCHDRDRYHELGSALEGCVHVDEDYKIMLLFIEKGGVAYGGDRDNPRCQDNVREKYELGRSSKALKTNARKNRMEDGILSKK